MSVLSFVWGLLPWWSWLAIVAGIIACTALGLWPVVFGLAKTIPLPVWITAAAAVFALMWIRGHDELLTQRVTTSVRAERDKYWLGREDASNKAHAAEMVALQMKVDKTLADAQAAAADQAQALAFERGKRKDAEAKLAEMRSRNVTSVAVGMCTLTRGVVLQYNAGAAVANGEAPPDGQPAAGAGPESPDSPAGVALDTYADSVAATQRALGEARGQVIGWQKYYSDVLAPWIASTVETLKACK